MDSPPLGEEPGLPLSFSLCLFLFVLPSAGELDEEEVLVQLTQVQRLLDLLLVPGREIHVKVQVELDVDVELKRLPAR